MSKFITRILTAVISVTFSVIAIASPTPVGYWKTIDDVTGQPKSIIKISQKNDALIGEVVKIFPRPGYDQNEVCSACEGARHNQRIVGMTVMQGLKQNTDQPTQWEQGQILDPHNGKTYRCNVQVTQNGEKLSVRGYIGIALFGRSQTWEKVNWKEEVKTL